VKINIHGDKIEVTSAIKEHIENKMAKLERYLEQPDAVEAKVIIRVKGISQTIEITLPTTKFTLRAEESHGDLYAATDLVIDKLERQIVKNKERLKKVKSTEPIGFIMDFDTEEDNVQKIVRRKTIESKPMDEEEAILQMELLNHDFFVFKNIDEECVSVVYIRKDGSYGIIDMK